MKSMMAIIIFCAAFLMIACGSGPGEAIDNTVMPDNDAAVTGDLSNNDKTAIADEDTVVIDSSVTDSDAAVQNDEATESVAATDDETETPDEDTAIVDSEKGDGDGGGSGPGTGKTRRALADAYCKFIVDPACGIDANTYSTIGAVTGLEACTAIKPCCEDIVKEWWACDAAKFSTANAEACNTCVTALTTCDAFKPLDAGWSCGASCNAICAQ